MLAFIVGARLDGNCSCCVNWNLFLDTVWLKPTKIWWNLWGGLRWVQTLTSSEKVDLGTDLVDVVFFFPLILLYPFALLKALGGEVFPLQTETGQSWRPKDTHWPHRKPGKDEGSHRLKSHRRSLMYFILDFYSVQQHLSKRDDLCLPKGRDGVACPVPMPRLPRQAELKCQYGQSPAWPR